MAEIHISRVSLPEGYGSDPPGEYISATAHITAKIGDLEPLSWALLPDYWGLESSNKWGNVKVEWRGQFESISQNLAQRIPAVLKPIVESAVREVEIDRLEFEVSPDGNVKLKKRTMPAVMTASSKRKWSSLLRHSPNTSAGGKKRGNLKMRGMGCQGI